MIHINTYYGKDLRKAVQFAARGGIAVSVFCIVLFPAIFLELASGPKDVVQPFLEKVAEILGRPVTPEMIPVIVGTSIFLGVLSLIGSGFLCVAVNKNSPDLMVLPILLNFTVLLFTPTIISIMFNNGFLYAVFFIALVPDVYTFIAMCSYYQYLKEPRNPTALNTGNEENLVLVQVQN